MFWSPGHSKVPDTFPMSVVHWESTSSCKGWQHPTRSCTLRCHPCTLKATTSTNADVKGRAKCITKAMKEASDVTLFHFLSDLFDVLNKLSFHFQRYHLILPSAVSLFLWSEGNYEPEAASLQPFHPGGHLLRRWLEPNSKPEGIGICGPPFCLKYLTEMTSKMSST